MPDTIESVGSRCPTPRMLRLEDNESLSLRGAGKKPIVLAHVRLRFPQARESFEFGERYSTLSKPARREHLYQHDDGGLECDRRAEEVGRGCGKAQSSPFTTTDSSVLSHRSHSERSVVEATRSPHLVRTDGNLVCYSKDHASCAVVCLVWLYLSLSPPGFDRPLLQISMPRHARSLTFPASATPPILQLGSAKKVLGTSGGQQRQQR